MWRDLPLAAILTACAAMAAERTSVGLMMEFPADASPVVRSEFMKETERALRGASLELAWRDLSEAKRWESFDRLVVIRFRGECRAAWAGLLRRSLPLGSTYSSGGHVQPFVEIDCQRVREAIGAGVWQGRQREILFGRALGRVAAHEIHHVLTDSSTHDDEGLMRPAFDQRDLCGSDLSFSRKSVWRLRISLGTAKASADD